MNSVRTFLSSRPGLLLAGSVLCAAALAGSQPRAAAAACVDAVVVNYYSDATLSTVVGRCSHDCCELFTCTGTQTPYQKTIARASCNGF